VLQVGERRLAIGSATADDVLALGATPSPNVAGDFSLSFGADGNASRVLTFQFESGTLDNVVVDINESDASAGTPQISLVRSGKPGRLDLPCSQEEAIAFFGHPMRTIYESRGGSVAASDD